VNPRRPLSAEQLAALPAFVRLLLSRHLGKAGMAETDQWLAPMRFGVPTTVFVDAAGSMNRQLGAQLQRLPLSVRNVRVCREVFNVDVAISKLAAVALHLPAHIRSLIFEHEGQPSSPARQEPKVPMLSLPLDQWTLPAGRTELQLPHLQPVDDKVHAVWGESISGEERDEQASGLPAALTILRLGAELDHSLAYVRLPSSLRVLDFGAAWSQPASEWPLLPDGLEELALPATYRHPLSSLPLPASLRKLHFSSLAQALRRPGMALELMLKSRLLKGATAATFPPALDSLHLPCSSLHESWRRSASMDPPLDLSLLPASLSSLRLADAQALCCTGSAGLTLQNLRIEVLELECVWEQTK
jgi:hypothetical protein